MSGEIAGSFCPFDRRLTIGLAIGTYFVSYHPVTPFAGLDDGITSPTVIGTAVLLHEDALCSHLDCLTNHDQLPPFTTIYFPELTGMIGFLDLRIGYKKKSYQLSVTRFGLTPNETN